MKMKSRNMCPLCAESDSVLVYGYDILSNRDERESIKFVMCKKCGMIYMNPVMERQWIEEFYKDYYIFGDIHDDGALRTEQLDFIERTIGGSCGSWYDIGAANGSFLSGVKNIGYEVHGIEPSVRAVDTAREKYGIRIEEGFFGKEVAERNRNKFDVVSMNHVLEHVEQPRVFLSQAKGVLKVGGRIFLEVPDLEKCIRPNVAEFFTIEHLNYFERDSLERLANRVGLQVEAYEKSDCKNAMRFILKADHGDGERISKDDEIRNNHEIVNNYIKSRMELVENLRKLVEKRGRKFVVYGAGLHTMYLVSAGVLRMDEIDSVVDSDRGKWGRSFFGHTIREPSVLRFNELPILISSYDSQQEIAKFLDEEYGISDFLCLYRR